MSEELLQYSKEAKLRISGLGLEKIKVITRYFPESQLKSLLAPIKAVPGFRKDSPRELQRRLERLEQILTSTNEFLLPNHNREWLAFGLMWLNWTGSTILNNNGLEKIDPKLLVNQVNKGDENLCDFIQKYIPSEKFSRITILSFLLYSPVEDHNSEKFSQLIELYPSEEALKRTIELLKIPTDIENLKESLKKVNLDIDEIKDKITPDKQNQKKIEARIELIYKNIASLEKKINVDLTATLKSLEETKNFNLAEIRKIEEQEERKRQKTNELIKSLDKTDILLKIENELNKIKKTVSDNSNQIETNSQNTKNIELYIEQEISHKINQLEETLIDKTVSSNNPNLSVETILVKAKDVKATSEDRFSKNCIEEITHRLDKAGFGPISKTIAKLMISSMLTNTPLIVDGRESDWLISKLLKVNSPKKFCTIDIPFGLKSASYGDKIQSI